MMSPTYRFPLLSAAMAWTPLHSPGRSGPSALLAGDGFAEAGGGQTAATARRRGDTPAAAGAHTTSGSRRHRQGPAGQTTPLGDRDGMRRSSRVPYGPHR